MNNATILYVSSSRENPEFERKIQETIIKNSGGLPIVSVTQKPIYKNGENYGSTSITPDGFIWENGKFGLNIIVGDVGASGFNFVRQLLIGAKYIKTDYIISAEADCLYPPDYFKFRPIKDNVCYRNTNTYIIGFKRDYYWKKREGGTWSQVINREHYIKRLEKLLEGEPMWDDTRKNFPKDKKMKFFDKFEYFETENPCISVKTGKGMRKFSHSERIPIYELPYWGNSKELVEKYGI